MGFVEHFANMARYSGFAVMSTSGRGGVPTTLQALSRVRSRWVQLSQDGDWNAIEERVAALSPADVALIGFQHVGLIRQL